MMNMKNNLVVLVLLYVAFNIPFSVMVLSNFMNGISASLEEAAIIDGAGYFQIYWNVAMPLSIPAISTISISGYLAITSCAPLARSSWHGAPFVPTRTAIFP